MKKFLVLLAIVCLTLPALAFADGEGEAIYKKSCAFCHDSGVAGAPRSVTRPPGKSASTKVWTT